jgi:hypothetical protein
MDDLRPLQAYYHEVLGLPVDHEEPGHIAAMGPVCAHDPTDCPPGTVRLYFLVEDATKYADVAAERGTEGTLRTDGFGRPLWESKDPFGNSVVLLTRP